MKYDTQHIDKYLNGELSQPEVKAFEEEMQNDKDFAYEVKLQQVAVETVQYANFMNKIEGLRKEIEAEEDTNDKKSVVPIRTGRRMMLRRIAAVAAVILLIPLVYYFSFRDSPSKIVAQNFDKVLSNINSSDTTMGTNNPSISNVDSIYQLGITYLEAEKYTQAHQQFDLLIADGKKRPEAAFNKAYAYWKKGEKDKAKQQLEKIINDKDATPDMKEKSKKILNNIK